MIAMRDNYQEAKCRALWEVFIQEHTLERLHLSLLDPRTV